VIWHFSLNGFFGNSVNGLLVALCVDVTARGRRVASSRCHPRSASSLCRRARAQRAAHLVLTIFNSDFSGFAALADLGSDSSWGSGDGRIRPERCSTPSDGLTATGVSPANRASTQDMMILWTKAKPVERKIKYPLK